MVNSAILIKKLVYRDKKRSDLKCFMCKQHSIASERIFSGLFCFQLPRCTMLEAGFKFMDAYEAEGLLGVCAFLVKVLKFKHILFDIVSSETDCSCFF